MAEFDLGQRYKQLLGYLSELDRLRTKPKSRVQEHEWFYYFEDLPSHDSVIFDPLEPDPENLLVVQQTEVPVPPVPDDRIRPWIVGATNDTRNLPTFLPELLQDDDIGPVSFDDSGVKEIAEEYERQWKDWASLALPALKAKRLYDKLYDIRASMKRDEDRYEFVLADVVVRWDHVEHPILMQPLELTFDPQNGRFTIALADSPSHIYGDAVRKLSDSTPEAINAAKSEIAENPDIWAFEGEATDLFATRFIKTASNEGRFVTDQSDTTLGPVAFRCPMLILKLRTTGLAELIESLLKKFEVDGEVPLPIGPIIGVANDEESEDEGSVCHFPDEDPDTYFTKVANKEQLQILRTYRKRKTVLVQGPPGTGKTHTIANLIGQFLAEGKSVLVTSQNPKALSVLRDLIVDPLKSLAVSVTGEGKSNHEEMSEGIDALSQGLNRHTKDDLAGRIDILQKKRPDILLDLRRARTDLETILNSERDDFEYQGTRLKPSQAARFVSEEADRHGWIPGSITSGAVIPLTDEELARLYNLNSDLDPDDEAAEPSNLPAVSELPTPTELELLVQQYENLSGQPQESLHGYLVHDLNTPDSLSELDTLAAEIEECLAHINDEEPWRVKLAQQGHENPTVKDVWAERFKVASHLHHEFISNQRDFDKYSFAIVNNVYLGDLESSLDGLLQASQQSKKPITRPRFLRNKQDKITFEGLRIKPGERFGDSESFKVALTFVRLERRKRQLADEWEKRKSEIGLTAPSNGEVQEHIVRLMPHIENALSWSNTSCQPLWSRLEAFGWNVQKWERECPGDLRANGVVDSKAWILKKRVLPLIQAAKHEATTHRVKTHLDNLTSRVEVFVVRSQPNLMTELLEAIEAGNVSLYRTVYNEIARVKSLETPVLERRDLLLKLATYAKDWASRVEYRQIGHEGPSLPGEARTAWKWKQLCQALDRRHALVIEEVNDRITTAKTSLEKCNTQLAFCKAWHAQHKRTDHATWTALNAIRTAMSQIGRGQGKKAIRAMKELREAMKNAKDAFPVWIMPLYKVAQSFDFTQTKFDVVIVDEASQLDATGLVPLLIASTAIVVGDDEQVEPQLIGVRDEDIKALIDLHLDGFPYKNLWIPQQSLYGFAGNFGAPISLVEHFRCVPEIIAFSSKKCYHGRIEPLRDASDVRTVPAVVPIHVEGSSRTGKQNEKEAEVLVSLMIAASEQPEYEGKTFGAITLKGDEKDQVILIDHMVKDRTTAEWVDTHKYLTGTPPQFQGDERHIVFLSMIDSPPPTSGPLRMERTRMMKQRFNVAASRAKDQLWVIHSLDYLKNLQPEDHRFDLLDFAHNSAHWLEQVTQTNPAADSPFESEIYRMLVASGYRAEPQYKVGAYRIDMVITGKGGRVAVECDGEAYHQDVIADMQRQLVLERCGWRFVRIRGSQYYRDKKKSFERMLEQIRALEVFPPSQESNESDAASGELLDRVLSRAQQIRDSWRKTIEDVVDQDLPDLFEEILSP